MGIFSAQGILGQAEVELTPALFKQVGRAYARTLKRLATAERLHKLNSILYELEHGVSPAQSSSLDHAPLDNTQRPRVLVGGDARLSTPILKNALINGLLMERCLVANLGSAPTPVLQYAIQKMELDGGLMVAASTQPLQYNGLKLYRNGRVLTALEMQLLQRELFELEKATARRALTDVHFPTSEITYIDLTEEYKSSLIAKVQLQRRVHVVVDGSNGCAGEVLAELLEMLECRTERLNTHPDGKFQNHPPDPSDNRNLAALIKAVTTTQADLGICIDSDGTNIGLVMEGGVPIPGNLVDFSISDDPADQYDNFQDALLAALRVVEALSQHREAIRMLVAHLP